MEELQACLDQKKILLTLLLNLSRQIEVQCAYEEPDDPSPLIFQRQVYLERLKKCVDRIAQVLEKLPDKEHERMTLVFSSRLPMAQCSAEERGASECEVECRSLLREISVSDAESKRQLKKECDRLQKLVSDSRGKGRKNSLFF
jgi:broad specificity phosphatase PhoE